jgi:hypothetical protein
MRARAGPPPQEKKVEEKLSLREQLARKKDLLKQKQGVAKG